MAVRHARPEYGKSESDGFARYAGPGQSIIDRVLFSAS
jgi:hypothetical protein